MQDCRSAVAFSAVRAGDHEGRLLGRIRAEDRDVAGEILAVPSLQIIATVAVDATARRDGGREELASRFGVVVRKALEHRSIPSTPQRSISSKSHCCGN